MSGRQMRPLALLISVLTGVALTAPLARAAPPYVPGEVVAKLKGQRVEHDMKLPPGVTVPQAVRYLRADPRVAYANPNYVAEGADLWNPNDPGRAGVAQGWRLDQWNFLTSAAGANVQAAWQNLRDAGAPGARGVTIAVLDTGVAYRPKGKYSRDPDLPPTTRFVHPKDFVDGDLLPLDENGHGTHVAGTIAQATNNGIGLTGAAYGATLMPVRVLNRQELGTASNVARGIRYAAQEGADVINLSLEFKPAVRQCSQIPGVCAAVQYAVGHGAVVVAAAGNQHQSTVALPARAPGAIGVGGSTYRGCLADYSDYGTGLDLVAPGGGTDTAADTSNPSCDPSAPGYAIRQYSLVPQAAAAGNFHKFSFVGLKGTSMAAAHVSGVAAMLMAEHPGWSPPEITDRLDACATLPGDPRYYGSGLLDAGTTTSSSIC